MSHPADLAGHLATNTGATAYHLRLLVRNRVLRGLVLVELVWSTGMVVFESFRPIRLAELVDGEEAAGALMGPFGAVVMGLVAGPRWWRRSRRSRSPLRCWALACTSRRCARNAPGHSPPR